MVNPNVVGQAELGQHLAQIREQAGISQAELARRLTWSQAVLSRVESGERSVSPEELHQILKQLDTPGATRLREVIQRDWSILPRPAIDHRDHDLLWDAEQVARDLSALREQPDVRNAFERRLRAFLDELQCTAALLLKRSHQVAFIGSIGIGKSTAICRTTGLTVPGLDGGQPAPVLEAGSGGITICEVHLRSGPQYGLIIEPRGEDEIRTEVTDFAEHILRGDAGSSEGSDAGNEGQGISKEIERAIRNMAGLRRTREKVDGKSVRRDGAKDLATIHPNSREFVVEVLARMQLHRRDRRDIWYEPSFDKPALVWLKEMFEQVNNGRHPDFTLPKRIEVVVPKPLLGETDLSVRIIDTKGIDRTAARADLEMHLDDPHTVVVLCTGFNNAPAAEPRLLLERALEAGVRTVRTHATLLVLPRPEEALAVKDESGVRVETVAEGYELKGDQIALALEPLGLANLPLCFFNAHQDDPESLRSVLSERIDRSRENSQNKLREIVLNARRLLDNYEQEQVQEVIRQASRMLQTWVSRHSKIPTPTGSLQASLVEQIQKAYASTVRATVRREGEWETLSFSHHLGFGARRMAAQSLGKSVEAFSELCKTLAENPQYAEAQDLLIQADRVLATSYEELLRKVQIMGQHAFRDELKAASALWLQCSQEWGSGAGYRGRVADHTLSWFHQPSQQNLKDQLLSMIGREWSQALLSVTNLFDGEHPEGA
ncbi:MAG: helix-turn-helix transcriptional regulator [Deltaproteobacteria bacterium]|nr:helix-turn-helix transcriptional regulator [Deltaproteobacteria bacterium]